MIKGRLSELDSLRGIAAIAVVLYHYTTRYDELFSHHKGKFYDFSYGYLGVNLFFIISGFVIFMTLTRVKDVGDFAKKRAIRLYPAYIVAVIITYTVVTVYGLENRQVSFLDALINLTMFQGHLPGVSHVDGAYWSLTVELTFYILIGIALYLGLTKRVILLTILWLLTSACIQVTDILIDTKVTSLLVSVSISKYSHLFIAGIMFYLIKESPKINYYAVLILCLLYEFIFMDVVSNAFVTMFFLVFYFIIKGKLTILNILPLVFLGNISYSLYLVHQNIGYVVINYMENQGMSSEIYLYIPIVISICLATLLTYYVERPIVKFFRGRMDMTKIKNIKTAINS